MAHNNQSDANKRKVATTYNFAADHFDDAPLAFWEMTGRRTIERLNLKSGALVLDVGCGTGASAIPAAHAVGAAGRVTGVDLAEKLLEQARAKAAQQQLTNIAFRAGDMTALGLPDNHFDAIVSVFSVFFVVDMEALVRDLWRMVKPGGTLAITTWGHSFFEPVYSVWREAVRSERPDLYSAFNPWDRISQPEQLGQLLQTSGIMNAEIIPENRSQPLKSPQDWWTIVLGSGLRGVIDEMDAATAARIRDHSVGWASANNISAIQTNVIYATAVKASA
jgi:ubiquinone/menaquinone biosynthesis C-methylase UbiE